MKMKTIYKMGAISANHVYDKALVSKIYIMSSYNSTIKRQITKLMGEGSEQTFFQRT